jgi:hypothetical protein
MGSPSFTATVGNLLAGCAVAVGDFEPFPTETFRRDDTTAARALAGDPEAQEVMAWDCFLAGRTRHWRGRGCPLLRPRRFPPR